MATLYWFQSGADGLWDTLTGNWWTDAAHTIQAGALPANGDSLYFLGGVPPNSGPASAQSFALIDTSNLAISWVMDINIWLAASATMVLGNAGGQHEFRGDCAGTIALATFSDDGKNSGNIVGLCVFNDTSSNGSTITGDATFNDTAYNNDTITGDATFNDSSDNRGTVSGNATFNNLAYNNTANISGATLVVFGATNTATHTGTFPSTMHAYGQPTVNGTFQSPTTVHLKSSAATFKTTTVTAGSVVVILGAGVLPSASDVWRSVVFDGGTQTGTHWSRGLFRRRFSAR